MYNKKYGVNFSIFSSISGNRKIKGWYKLAAMTDYSDSGNKNKTKEGVSHFGNEKW